MPVNQVGHSIVSIILFTPLGGAVPPFSVVVKCEFTRSASGLPLGLMPRWAETGAYYQTIAVASELILDINVSKM
jgi:hypothetical protein